MGKTLKQIEQEMENLKNDIEELKKKSAARFSKKLVVGDVFNLAGVEWKILDITDKGYHCLAEKVGKDRSFDSTCNDWRKSSLREYLNGEFYEKLAEEISGENIVLFERDLLSLDGQTEFESCTDKVSLLTVDEYRKYRSLIPNTDAYWWWLITPWSTPCNDYKTLVTVVSPSGDFGNGSCNYGDGVRPFCIFSHSIFESEEE